MVAIPTAPTEHHLHVRVPALSMTRPRSLRGYLLTNSCVSAAARLLIIRLFVPHGSPTFLRMQISFNIAEGIGVVTQAMLDEVVGFERRIKGQILLHIGSDLGVL